MRFKKVVKYRILRRLTVNSNSKLNIEAITRKAPRGQGLDFPIRIKGMADGLAALKLWQGAFFYDAGLKNPGCGA
jgi:hypothetical protein